MTVRFMRAILGRGIASQRFQAVSGFKVGLRSMCQMTPSQLDFYKKNGYVKVPKAFSDAEMQDLKSWVEEVQNWLASKTKWMHHYEEVDAPDSMQLARTENI